MHRTFYATSGCRGSTLKNNSSQSLTPATLPGILIDLVVPERPHGCDGSNDAAVHQGDGPAGPNEERRQEVFHLGREGEPG